MDASKGLILAARFGTPLLVLSRQAIRHNYELMRQYLPTVMVHYAVKANPFAPIISELDRLGSNFDVASDGEIEQLAAQNIGGWRMVYANPVNTLRGVASAVRHGLRYCTFDSVGEAEKIAAHWPQAEALVRLRVVNSQALVDLNKKFGVLPEEVLPLIRAARDRGVHVVGICFHVGSQALSPRPYQQALADCRELIAQAADEGFELRIVDIGGGFPVLPLSRRGELIGMLQAVDRALTECLPPAVEVWSEPGRVICASAVTLLTSVIGSRLRDDHRWYFLDEGIYGTFSGVVFDHWEFELMACNPGRTGREKATFAGPSCDSFDVMFENRETPPLEIGDVLMSPNCGAYTSASATVFNGFAKAGMVVLEDEFPGCEQ
ncbi:MAG: type III PLP-dependent enzyme [Negativicutes bacterium]|nr:type III PLP-dependent enzyme [Negativicutes bacterium]